MRIINSTQSIVTCNCGEKQVQIMPQQFEEIQFDSKIKISLSKDSYFCNLAGSSKLLKLLSLLSDPFHLQKEYHGVLETVYETEFTSSSTSTLKITEASICVDPKLQLYYDFCELKANDEVYRPISVKRKDMNSLKKVFLENEKKLITDKINYALEWQKKTDIPTWVGAWMPGNYNDGDDYSVEEQVIFADFMTSALVNAKIPFAVNSDTKFYDRENNNWIDNMQPVFNIIFK